MDLTFLMDLPELSSWKILKNELLPKEVTHLWKNEEPLGSYNLVHVLVDKQGKPSLFKFHEHDTSTYLAFTRPEYFSEMKKVHELPRPDSSQLEVVGNLEESMASALEETSLKIMMIGELIEQLNEREGETAIKINPKPVMVSKGVRPLIFCEEVVFAPQFDEFTFKKLLTDPEEAKALLAINPEDEKRFGIEIVFYMLTNRGLPEEGEQREAGLIERVEELAFKAPRVPLKRGSGSFVAVLLNLENEIEERAFIRDYSTFDYYSDLIFVTSTLKLWTGKLEEIHFNGEKIDTIFAPLIKWQQGKKKRSPYFKN